MRKGTAMTGIRLYNGKTRTKVDFAPIDPDNVRIYVCGPTVYDRAHLGNGRPVVVFDVLFRLMRHVYGADHVTYVRNFTDVDDKINATAQARKAAGDPRSLEALIHERTEETIGWYHADMDALGALRPTFEPRATEYIGPMIAMIEGLIGSGDASQIEEAKMLMIQLNGSSARDRSGEPELHYEWEASLIRALDILSIEIMRATERLAESRAA